MYVGVCGVTGPGNDVSLGGLCGKWFSLLCGSEGRRMVVLVQGVKNWVECTNACVSFNKLFCRLYWNI